MHCQRLMPLATLLTLGLLASTALAGAARDLRVVPRPRGQGAAGRYAVIVAVGEYDDPVISDLKYSVADAKALQSVLTDPDIGGFNARDVVVMTDEAADAVHKPTRNNILNMLTVWARRAGNPEDTILFFFAGHGIDAAGQTYLLGSDAREAIPADSGVRLARVREILSSECRAQRKILFLDACHSGEPGRAAGRPMSDAFVQELNRWEGIVTFSSCKQNEKSYDYDKKGHGAFTCFLLEALRGAADTKGDRNGFVDLGELRKYVWSRTSAWAAQKGVSQNPFCRMEATGVVYLAKARTSATARRRWRVYTEWPFDAAEAKRRQEDAARALGVKVEQELELARGVKITMVLIPAGEFMMGSPETEEQRSDNEKLHRVTITKPFWMSKCEVAQEQWQAVMGSNPSRFKGGKNPVEQVSWNSIQEFLKKVTATSGQASFALPTEAQWEYGCRGGSDKPYCFGDDEGQVAKYAWQRSNADSKTHPVGTLLPNAWGLHDMHGNVWEWCSSPYSETYDGSEMKGAEAEARLRVLRGGSCGNAPRFCRSATRERLDPTFTFSGLGFRLVVSSAARTSP